MSDAPQELTTAAELEGAAAAVSAGGRAPLDVIDVRTGQFGASGSGDTSGYGGLVTTVVLPGPTARPYGGWFDEVVDVLAEVLEESGTPFDAAV
ncbi:MAG TPA: NADH-quinone oxidoreductase subunit C, partial [Cellulomonas sp.]